MPKRTPSRKGLEPIESLGETQTNMFMPDDSKRAYAIIGYFEKTKQDDKEPDIHKIRELNTLKCRLALIAIEQISAGKIPHTSGFWLQELKERTAGPWSWQPWHEELEQQCQELEISNPVFGAEVAKSLGFYVSDLEK